MTLSSTKDMIKISICKVICAQRQKLVLANYDFYAQYLSPSRIIPAAKQLGKEAQATYLSPKSPDFG